MVAHGRLVMGLTEEEPANIVNETRKKMKQWERNGLLIALILLFNGEKIESSTAWSKGDPTF